jgi:hypothetical protein
MVSLFWPTKLPDASSGVFLEENNLVGADIAWLLASSGLVLLMTPVIIGTEQLAKKFDYPVIYTHVIRVKRGYYRCEYYPVSLNPKATADYEITETYMKILEEKINEKPEFWLWTHKRWKHKRETISTVRNRS